MNAQPFCLPDDDRNRGIALCHKVNGIVECLRSASFSNDPPPGDAIACACWVASDLIYELEKIIELHQPGDVDNVVQFPDAV